MDINLTLFGQAITFGIFVWFTMTYVWPPIMSAISERQTKIADGLAAAKQGEEALEKAQVEVDKLLADAKRQANEIIEQASKRATQMVEEAKGQAKEEGDRMLESARSEIGQEANRTRELLRKEVAGVVMLGAEKILGESIDEKIHGSLLDNLAANM